MPLRLPASSSPVILAGLLAGLLVAGCASLSGNPVPPGTPRVRLSLESLPPVVAPGGETLLLARFNIPRDWHLYWTNPGDSGLPPELTWSLPAGWSTGQPLFPVPLEHVSEAGRSWIHQDELVLCVPLRAPADATPGERVAIRLDATWLACHEACVPGGGQAKLGLRVVDQVPPRDGKRPRQDVYPRPWSGRPVEWKVDSGQLRLDFPDWP